MLTSDFDEFEGHINRGDLIELKPEMMMVPPKGPARVIHADNKAGAYDVMDTSSGYRVTCFRMDIKGIVGKIEDNLEFKTGDLVRIVQRLGCMDPPNLRDLGSALVLGVEECEALCIKGEKIRVGNNVIVSLDGEIKTFHESDVHLI